MQVEQIAYAGWRNCYRLTNDLIDLVITADVGPRVIRFGFVGEHNEFAEVREQIGLVGGSAWRLYGGHRLWNAPESLERTYLPDNQPVQVIVEDDGVTVCQPVEEQTGIQKEMVFALSDDQASVKVVHRLRNCGDNPQQLAPWAVTVMPAGGTAIVPLPPRASHEENSLPNGTLALWAYTDFTDPRWTWGQKYVQLSPDAAVPNSQKLGLANVLGWLAYANDSHLFVKTACYKEGAAYPDWGSSTEVYTEGCMLEIETLSPCIQVPPGDAVEHVENWFLFRDVPFPRSETDIDQTVLPLVRSVV